MLAGSVDGLNNGAMEAWRQRLSTGDLVTVKSASGGGWLLGRILETNAERVKVLYVVGNEMCDKTLLRTSSELLLPGTRTTAAPFPAPARGRGASHPNTRTSQCPTSLYPSSLHPAPPGPFEALAEGFGQGGMTPTTPLPPLPPLLGGASSPWAPHPPDPLPIVPAAPPASSQLGATTTTPITARSPSHSMSIEGLRVSDITFGEVLGSGGFGKVHRGWLRGEEVAIKQMHLTVGSQISAEQLSEFTKEVANLQALRHPRLIGLIGVALEPPVLCMVTELAAGGSLYALLHVQRVPLAEARRRLIVLQICEGVAVLHSLQPPKVHRDLKSANVVLDADLNAKLCDFGLTESMESTHISRRDAEGGSPRYMAPEVFDARCKITEKVDIWALGCLIVEVITDVLPHNDCTTIHQIAAKLLVRQLGPFSPEWGAGLHSEVGCLVGTCFFRSAAARPSAASLHDRLECLDIFIASDSVT